MNLTEKTERIFHQANKSYWAGRIAAEIDYAHRLSRTRSGEFDEPVEAAADAVLAELDSAGTVTDQCAKFAESLLLPLSAECKKYSVHCVAHAHIDMNWMWGFQETAAVTVDTFRTMLDLMEEYPQFTFAQSQASVYRIVEQYAPSMLEEIKKRVDEGRWDLSSTTWVETDKNMPSGESLCRHILYTKRYFNRIFGRSFEDQKVDFEPDTFGHSANIPEICAHGRVKYYYHCRGEEDLVAYKWRADSGAELLVWKDPAWYNSEIEPFCFHMVPEVCSKYGVNVFLRCYGVGDHGGGPTRRDIERLIDMQSWPIMATLKFGTINGFFEELEKCSDGLPVATGERNFVFTGCYSSQSRVKMSNRIGEARLYEAEALSAGARLVGGEDRSEGFAKAWEKILFNHFHDILPGSGVIETREYALGNFQSALAEANVAATAAMRRISDSTDTSAVLADLDDRHTLSEGAGVGFATDQASGFRFSQVGHARGKTRIFTLFNTAQYSRDIPFEITMWDWPGDPGRLRAKDIDGREIKVRVKNSGTHYWGHHYLTLELACEIPALGYTTAIIYETEKSFAPFSFPDYGRRDHINDDDPILENELVKAVFDRRTMKLISLTDKKNGRQLIDKPSAFFRYILEDDVHGMTSWRVGSYSEITDVNESCPVRIEHVSGDTVFYKTSFKNSSLEVRITLPSNSPTLEFNLRADWHEVGRQGVGTPQLNFTLPFSFEASGYTSDIPAGILTRPAASHDVPCLSFMAADGIQVTCDSRYGFRGNKNSISVTLIRSSYDPDPYPEYGIHNVRIGVSAVTEPSGDSYSRISDLFCHPVSFVTASAHSGELPAEGSLFKLSGKNVRVSAVKTPEDGKNGYILRLYNSSDKETVATVKLPASPKGVYRTDAAESTDLPLLTAGKEISVKLLPGKIAALRIVP